MKNISKLTALVAITSAVLLAGCGSPPLASRTNIEAKYPDAKITQIEQYAQLLRGPTQWLVETEEGIIIAWCNDRGQWMHEQQISSR